MEKKKAKVDRDTVLGQALDIKGADKVLADNKVPCLHCPMAKMEMDTLKIGQICSMYGIDEKKLIKELNELK